MKQKRSLKIWIIESLRKNDEKTGFKLETNISDYLAYENKKYQDKDILVTYRNPVAKQEFLNVLNEILDETEKGTYPIIHLECHGCQKGLEIAGEEIIEWNELSDIFRKINHACRLNLLIVVAACEGIYLIKTAEELGRAPFLAVVGSIYKLYPDEIKEDFYAFYAEFFKGFEFNLAMKKINQKTQKYKLSSAESLFIESFKRLHKEIDIGKGKQESIESLLTNFLKDESLIEMITTSEYENSENPLKFIRDFLKKAWKDMPELYFNEFKDMYFFIDCYEENAERFPFSYQDVISNPDLL